MHGAYSNACTQQYLKEDDPLENRHIHLLDSFGSQVEINLSAICCCSKNVTTCALLSMLQDVRQSCLQVWFPRSYNEMWGRANKLGPSMTWSFII